LAGVFTLICAGLLGLPMSWRGGIDAQGKVEQKTTEKIGKRMAGFNQ